MQTLCPLENPSAIYSLPSLSVDSVNCELYNTVVPTDGKKNPHISGPMQIKLVSFKAQLYVEFSNLENFKILENNPLSHYVGICLLDQPFLSSVLFFSHRLTQKPLEHRLNYKPGTELQTTDDLLAPFTIGNMRFAAASRHHTWVLAKN